MSEVQPEVPALAPVAPEAPVDAAPAEPVVEAAPEATPVLQQTPSSDAPAPAPVEDAPKASTIEQAAANLLALIDEGHKIGDRFVDEAREELRALLS